MRKQPLRLLFAMLFVTAISKNSFAQYVTIPDTAFVNWLQTGGYGSCMAGNQLDTTCQWVTGPIQFFIVSSDIRDLDGIQYFDSAVALICFCDSLVSIPSFPPSLHTIQLAKTGLVNRLIGCAAHYRMYFHTLNQLRWPVKRVWRLIYYSPATSW